MNKDIKQKIENKRIELTRESLILRADAKKLHKCPNCGKEVAPRRLYCSYKCSIEFQRKHDYSKNSKILKEYKQQLIDMQKIEKPAKEINPVSTLVARKTYKCILCGLDINKGDRYYKYVRLPGYDEWFDEAPYEVSHYHLNCMAFFKLLVDADMGEGEDEGFPEEWIPTIYYAFSLETNQGLLDLKKNIIAGNFPSRDVIEEISKEYEGLDPFYWFYGDNSPYKYIYSVKFIAYGSLIFKDLIDTIFSK